MSKSQKLEYILCMEKLEGFKFVIDFRKETIPDLMMDEPEEVPGGESKGPTASMLLAAAIGNCLSASLNFCLTKKNIPVSGFKTKVQVVRERNDKGFWRISEVNVDLMPEVESLGDPATKRCIDIFRNYCVVSASIEEGININVNIQK